MNKIVFTPSDADVLTAAKLHYRGLSVKKLLLFMLFGGAVGAAVSILAGHSDIYGIIGMVAGMTIWAAVVAVIMVTVVRVWWIPRLSRKTYAQQRDLQMETEIWWDDDAYFAKTPQSSSTTPFADYAKWTANEDMLLMYRSDHLYNFLPMRVFENGAQFDALKRRLIAAGVEEKEK